MWLNLTLGLLFGIPPWLFYWLAEGRAPTVCLHICALSPLSPQGAQNIPSCCARNVYHNSSHQVPVWESNHMPLPTCTVGSFEGPATWCPSVVPLFPAVFLSSGLGVIRSSAGTSLRSMGGVGFSQGAVHGYYPSGSVSCRRRLCTATRHSLRAGSLSLRFSQQTPECL